MFKRSGDPRKADHGAKRYKLSCYAFLMIPVVTFFIFNDIQAQKRQLSFEQVSGTSGISLGKINAILQDNYGFIWLSDQTNRCIVRYDGNSMKRYAYDQGKPNSLPGYYPECFATDSSGIICQPWNGIKITHFIIEQESKPLCNNT